MDMDKIQSFQIQMKHLENQKQELTEDLRQVKNNLLAFLETLGIAKEGKIKPTLELSDVMSSIIDVGQQAMGANTPWASAAKKEKFANKFKCISQMMPLLTKYENL